MFAVHELGFLATRVDVAICANVMDFCVRRQPTTREPIRLPENQYPVFGIYKNGVID